jgi:antirestriction protein ArdC
LSARHGDPPWPSRAPTSIPASLQKSSPPSRPAPDTTGCPGITNVSSQRRYRGVNVLALWIAAEAAGYASGIWGTYHQWQAAGAQVRRDEKGTTVILWKQVASNGSEDDEDDETSARQRIFARAFIVFNVAQIDGYTPPPVPVLSETERCADAERFIDHLSITTVFDGSEAYYRPSNDTVYMPPFSQFRDATSFYGVRLHLIGNIASVLARSRVSSLR